MIDMGALTWRRPTLRKVSLILNSIDGRPGRPQNSGGLISVRAAAFGGFASEGRRGPGGPISNENEVARHMGSVNGRLRTPSAAQTLGGDDPTPRPYGGLARIYDYEYGPYQADISFYLDRLRSNRVKGTLLDLGTGTGRIALALASAGYSVVGLDNSPAMLRRARRKRLRLPPEMYHRVRFSQQDMAGFTFRRTFAAALICFSTLAMLPSPEMRRACLERTYRHLDPGGLLYVDLFAPEDESGARWTEHRHRKDTFRIPPFGHVVEKETIEQHLPDGRTMAVRYQYRIRRYWDEAPLGGFVVAFNLAKLSRAEVEASLEEAGFVVEEVFGDYHGGPFGPEGGRMIFEARRG